MKKSLFFVCMFLPICAATAQTFQRKTQQPAFFMPKSAISTAQPERLPTVESMNYQGYHPVRAQTQPESQTQPNVSARVPVQSSAQPKAEQQRAEQQKPVSLVAEQNTQKTAEKSDIKQKAENKQTPASVRKAGNDAPVDSDNISADDYQKIFANILNRHRADLMRISQGDYSESQDISDMISSYKPGIHSIKERVYPRRVSIK